MDGHSIRSEADFHDAIDQLARSIGFEGYGRNLDAFWDVISGILPHPVEVQWLHADASKAVLGSRFEQIASILRKAEQEFGPSVRVAIKP